MRYIVGPGTSQRRLFLHVAMSPARAGSGLVRYPRKLFQGAPSAVSYHNGPRPPCRRTTYISVWVNSTGWQSRVNGDTREKHSKNSPGRSRIPRAGVATCPERECSDGEQTRSVRGRRQPVMWTAVIGGEHECGTTAGADCERAGGDAA